MSLMRTNVPSHKGLFPADTTPSGYGPSDFQSAYSLPSATAGTGETVAIVDAGDDPTAEADLGVYRSQYGLPVCTTANGCFEKVNQEGQQGNYPPVSGDWPVEESLDIDMVSAVCPNCHILLVEASSASTTDLYAAEDEAVALGAKYVSNSWALPEQELGSAAAEAQADTYFNHPGVVITAAGGDNGYDNYQEADDSPNYPASSQYVTSVGGTTLTQDSSVSRGWTETTWSPDPSATGSGCSLYEPKPAWRTDSGCANRMTNDVSADADPDTGAAIYDTTGDGGWDVVGGTSEATPIIAATYALAGSPEADTNPASYPYLNATGLNDVTSGTNYDQSCNPAYFCTAGPGYDGPTGLGTPDGVSAFAPVSYGTVTGTVTDAATGKPIAGAQVSAGSGLVQSSATGQYTLAIPPGSYTVTAKAFGYVTGTASGVTVTAGQGTTQNFSLAAAPTVTVSGVVRDGSGHHWPLYAKISVPGTSAVTYTNPATGRYQLAMPQNSDWPVEVDPLYTGYQDVQRQVTVGTSALMQNFAAPVDASTCNAPGYRLKGTTQTFSSSTAPPGWTVANAPGTDAVWSFSNPGDLTNNTGGTGNFAVADGSLLTASQTQNTTLYTPVIDMTHDKLPVLRFNLDAPGSGPPNDSTHTVDLSIDGGKNWTTLWSSIAYPGISGPDQMSIALPQAAGEPSVQVRFVSTVANLTSEHFELDNVLLGNCAPIAGGLVEGRVTDKNTATAVNGATVASPSQNATTTATPDDPAVGGGFYWMFVSPATGQKLTASSAYYSTVARAVRVRPNLTAQRDFILPAARLAVSPGSLSATQMLGGSTTETLTVTNTGSAPGRVKLAGQPGTFTLAGQPSALRPAAASTSGSSRLELVKGHYSPFALAAGAHRETRALTTPGVSHTASGSGWQPVPSYPAPTADNAAATDPGSGDVYSVGGVIAGLVTAAGYVYDPQTQMWTSLPAMPQAREKPAAAFLNGKLYVVGGWDSTGSSTRQLQIYNPASGKWSMGPSEPNAEAASGVAVLDGRMYVVGGCSSSCGSTDVQVYDPATGKWSLAAPYRESTAWEGCGGIARKLYCAGGDTGDGTSHAYSYDPAANTWSVITSLPIDLWGGGYAVADGKLLLSGGVTDQSQELTNQGFAYTPGKGWSALPDSTGTPSYRGGSACGFYQVGGYDVNGDLLDSAQTLPGYTECGDIQNVGWLSASPAVTILAPGHSATVTVTLSSGGPSADQPGTYTAALLAVNTTPYHITADPVAVTLTVAPPKTWGEFAGTVSGRICGGKTKPLPGATVQVDSWAGNQTLTAGPKGTYALWLDKRGNPFTLIAADTGWQSQARQASITAGQATTENFTLAEDGCG